MISDVKTNDAPAGRGLSRRAFGGLTLATLAGAQMAGGPAAAADQLELKMQFASPDGTPWNDMDRRFGKQLEAITGGKVKFFRRTRSPRSRTGCRQPAPACSTSALSGIRFCRASSRRWSFSACRACRRTSPSPPSSTGGCATSSRKWASCLPTRTMSSISPPSSRWARICIPASPYDGLADLKGKVFAAQDLGRRAGAAKAWRERQRDGRAGRLSGPAARRGDGVLCAWGWVNNFKLNEVTTYHTLLNLNPGSYSTVMNRDTFKS